MLAARWPPPGDDSFIPAENPYWDPEIETMPPEERAQLVLRKLKAQLAYCASNSDFYRGRWAAAGIDPGSISSLDDIRRVPILRKEELRTEQTEHPPFGRYLCIPRDKVLRIHGTSGTTGRPTAFGVSQGDWQRIATAHARIMWAAGIRPNDTIFIGSFFGLYWGGWGALIGAERLGATCFPFGAGVPGQTLQAVEWLAQMRPTAFYGTPSYALRIAEVARDAGYDPADFGIRVLFFSGEPGAGIPATKQLIESTFGGICIDMGSMAEMSPWMSNAECHERTGMHLWDDLVYTELLDPVTEEPVGPGEVGVLVYTHLERDSQPMIRLWSGDLSRYTDEPCPCGRTYRRLPDGLLGRADDMLVIRGENVYPAAIEEAIRAAGCSGEFRVTVVRQGALDEMKVRTEAVAGHSDNDLRNSVVSHLKKKLGLRVEVEIAPAGSLERTEFKSRRVSDERTMSQDVQSILDSR
ncbi:coenzyme F390 synthetase [Pseudonocardia sulfidoxydans NBRC 16205]|uniref:Coenzyme F390 synthetase n=3 Tax=Pseudonocardia sulfidoxydans TaxID=54011 RepID=A0A511DQ46_9PSEU|nr:coenzyme F390 synthetase [Pseudonocardia sulfidoxydans NBRC 16205]